MTMTDDQRDPQAGGADGAASDPTSGEGTAADRPGSDVSGDIEIPIGIPVSGDEFRRLKEDARTPRRPDDAEQPPGTMQEDDRTGPD